MGAYQRTKGHDFERDCAQKLRTVGFSKTVRILEYQIENCQGVDLAHTDPFKVQCKCMAKVPNIPQVFKEFTALKPGEIPVVMFKVTNKGEFAALRMADFLALLERARYSTGDASESSDPHAEA